MTVREFVRRWRRRDRHVHDYAIACTPTRIFLRCACGSTTPGWYLFELPPGCTRFIARG